MSGPLWIGCKLASEPPGLTASAKRRCHVCNRQIWVAPASLAVAAKHGGLLTCLECFARGALQRQIESGEPPDVAVTDQQEIELFRATGETMTEVLHRLGIKPRKLP